MLAGYEKLAAQITNGAQEEKPENEPLKREWAYQEGYKPHYNPNSDEVSWIPAPKPAYSVPNNLRLQGSMSPERLAEVYPAFAEKSEQIDPLLTKIYQAALSGEITHQRAQELVLQLAADTQKEAWSGKAKGASKQAANFDQSISNMSKSNRIAGE